MKEVFDEIYRNSTWGYKSGSGSDPENAKPWIDTVNSYLSLDKVKTVLDIGCGDWRLGAEYNLEGKSYLGVDVSSEALQGRTDTDNVKFKVTNALTMDIPQSDLILIKDVLQHLPTSDVIELMPKLIEKSKILLVCNDFTNVNTDTYAGGYRGLNLTIPPFSLSATDSWSFDSSPYRKTVYVFLNNN